MQHLSISLKQMHLDESVYPWAESRKIFQVFNGMYTRQLRVYREPHALTPFANQTIRPCQVKGPLTCRSRRRVPASSSSSPSSEGREWLQRQGPLLPRPRVAPTHALTRHDRHLFCLQWSVCVHDRQWWWWWFKGGLPTHENNSIRSNTVYNQPSL